MRLILLYSLCLASISATAQDLSGIWRGHFNSASSFNRFYDSLNIYDRYKYETQINQSDKSFDGITYSYKSTVFYGKASCYGAINPKTKKVLLEENGMLELRMQGGVACLMTLFLQYSKVGNEEFLEGTFTSMNVKDSTSCGGGTVFLRKVPTTDFYMEPFLAEKPKPKMSPPGARINPPVKPLKSDTPKVATAPKAKKTVPPIVTKKPPVAAKQKSDLRKTTPKPKPPTDDLAKKNQTLKQLPADTVKKNSPEPSIAIPRVLTARQNELVRTITSSAKDIYIKIYDNGTIDNDTVSVYVDKKLVISKQRLTDKAITVKITLDDRKDFHELIMVAENLGEIPPNTSLMVVNAGEQQYEVRITSTEQKNAVVHFRYGGEK